MNRQKCRSIFKKTVTTFSRYLKSHHFNVKGATSCSKELRCSVPQRSVLGPILYVLYTSQLGDIVKSHGLSCHFYADDTQLYCSFSASNWVLFKWYWGMDACKHVKMNRDKTELLVIGPNHKVNPSINGIHAAGEYIEVSNNVRNIGVIFFPMST